MNEMAQKHGWAIVNLRGNLMLFSGQLPIYWHRKVAMSIAAEHGLNPYARVGNCRVVKVTIGSPRK